MKYIIKITVIWTTSYILSKFIKKKKKNFQQKSNLPNRISSISRRTLPVIRNLSRLTSKPQTEVTSSCSMSKTLANLCSKAFSDVSNSNGSILVKSASGGQGIHPILKQHPRAIVPWMIISQGGDSTSSLHYVYDSRTSYRCLHRFS